MAYGQNRTVVRLVHTVFHAGTVAGQSDAQLLARFATRGDDAAEVAFTALVERHGPMVLRVCRGILRDEHDAQDAFQATFLVLARKAGSLWTRDSLGPWLYGVASRTASCARSAGMLRRKHERRAAESIGRFVVAEEDRDDLGPCLHEEISKLPERYRRPILLCYFEGLTHDQAAGRLGWPVGTVRSRLARARERLRTRLTGRGIAPDAIHLDVLPFGLGALPARLVDPTVNAAMRVAAGEAVGAGLVSASAAALTEGVLRTMLVSKLKATAAVLLAVGAITSGVGLHARQAPDPEPQPKSSALPSPRPVARSRVAEDLDAFAAEMERLVKRARQEQAQGDIEGAARDLNQVELGASRWRKALTNTRRSGNDTLRSRPSLAAPTNDAVRGLPSLPAQSEMPSLPARSELPSLPAQSELPPPDDSLPAEPPQPVERLDPGLPDQAPRPVDRLSLPLSDRAARPVNRSTPLPITPTQSPGASPPGSAEHRLGELERKVQRILDALEKGARESAPGRSRAGQDGKPAAPPPPAVEGHITKADNKTGRVEISIGSDEGLVRGHELNVYRTDPSRKSSAGPVYLGRIRILLTDPDRAFGEVIEWTGDEHFKVGNIILTPRTPPIEGERASTGP